MKRQTIFVGIMILTGCIIMADEPAFQENRNRSNNAEAKMFLERYPNGDFFVMEECICIKFIDFNTGVDYNIDNQIISEENYIGSIQRTGLQSNWERWDATILKAGTRIYQHTGRQDVLIALQDGVKIPYIKNLEY
jgi:hypothetical protein